MLVRLESGKQEGEGYEKGFRVMQQSDEIRSGKSEYGVWIISKRKRH